MRKAREESDNLREEYENKLNEIQNQMRTLNKNHREALSKAKNESDLYVSK